MTKGVVQNAWHLEILFFISIVFYGYTNVLKSISKPRFSGYV